MSTFSTLRTASNSHSGYTHYMASADIQSSGSVKVCKSWILSDSLSSAAKMTLVALLNFHREGESVYPAANTIRSIIHIGRDKFRRAVSELVMEGFISVTAHGTNRYGNTLYSYTIHSKALDDSEGFGFVPRTVLYDPRFGEGRGYKVKLLYSILSAFAGTTGVARPRVRDLCYWLGNGEERVCLKTYHSYMHELKRYGYVNVSDRRDSEHNRFAGNTYTLIQGRPVVQGRRAVRVNHQNVSCQHIGKRLADVLGKDMAKSILFAERNLMHAAKPVHGVNTDRIHYLTEKYKGVDGHLSEDILISVAENFQRKTALMPGEITNTTEYLRVSLLNDLRKREGEKFTITSAEERRMNAVPTTEDTDEIDPLILQILRGITS